MDSLWRWSLGTVETDTTRILSVELSEMSDIELEAIWCFDLPVCGQSILETLDYGISASVTGETEMVYSKKEPPDRRRVDNGRKCSKERMAFSKGCGHFPT